jgi:cytochrome b561
LSVLSYSGPAIALHWLVAALLFLTVPLGLYMTGLPFSPQKLQLYAWHKWIGVTVFLLAAVRLAWRLTHRPPPHEPSVPAWQRGAADAAHALLYVLLFAVPLSGWLYSSAVGVPTVYLGLWQLPDLVTRDRELAETLKLVHKSLNVSLAALVLLHVGAVVRHQFVLRNGVLARMAPFVRPRHGARS